MPPRPNALHNSNKLKLGLFSLNADGGIAITKVPERWQAGWADSAPVLDFFGTQLTATALLLMLSASVFDVGSVLLLTSEVRESDPGQDLST